MRVRREKAIGAQRQGLHAKILVKMVLAAAMGERVRSRFLSGAWQSAWTMVWRLVARCIESATIFVRRPELVAKVLARQFRGFSSGDEQYASIGGAAIMNGEVKAWRSMYGAGKSARRTRDHLKVAATLVSPGSIPLWSQTENERRVCSSNMANAQAIRALDSWEQL